MRNVICSRATSKRAIRRLAAITNTVFSLTATFAAALATSMAIALPQYDESKHTGVASCASSVCHGKSTAATDSNVMLNEYKLWTTEDRHANAYKTLLSVESKRIASNLGLSAPAHKAKICLDCHTDNVAPEKQGKEFRIDDGVGCEACHGGAEHWLESHTEPGVTHANNLKNHMYPTEDGFARAKLCLSCHLGTDKKLANHEIMGAGHPRLVFELESFTANQPAHYKVDADYIKRKGEFSGLRMWAVGQLSAAQQTLSLMQNHLSKTPGLFPELVLFDCQACHHPMSDKRWQQTSSAGKTAPGTVRLNLVNLLMLREFIAVLYPNRSADFNTALVQLNQASQKAPATLDASINAMATTLQPLQEQLLTATLTDAHTKKIRARLLSQAASGEFYDYIVAEQAFYSIEGFTIGLNQFDKYKTQLDKLYKVLKSENTYQPKQFSAVARTVASSFE